MNPTRNTLAAGVRETMISELNGRLAESLDLYFQAKHAHWNLKGLQFISLHELFDEVASHLADFSDTLAERAVVLGGIAPGTIQAVGKGSTLPAYPVDLLAAEKHVDALSTSLAEFAGRVRNSIGAAEAAGDPGTADLFTEVVRGVDKDLWFLEAHLQNK